MNENYYKCAVCNGEFEKGWSDEEAHEEYLKNFGKNNTDEIEIICDDCYKLVMKKLTN